MPLFMLFSCGGALLNGSLLILIKKVSLHRAWLVLG